MPTCRPAVLRPRELVIELVARALDDDLDAEAELHALAAIDPRADTALDALAAAAVQALTATDASGYSLPPADPALLDQVLAAVEARTGLGRPTGPVAGPPTTPHGPGATEACSSRGEAHGGGEDGWS